MTVDEVRIEFAVRPARKGRPAEVVIRIDGRDLIDWLREVEQPAADAEGHPELAGSYRGLEPGMADLTAHFLGQGEPLFSSDAHVEVLSCAHCGEPGCWPFEVAVEAAVDSVRWRAYRQPHRPGWDYSGLPEWEFTRAEYEAALVGIG